MLSVLAADVGVTVGAMEKENMFYYIYYSNVSISVCTLIPFAWFYVIVVGLLNLDIAFDGHKLLVRTSCKIDTTPLLELITVFSFVVSMFT